MENHQKFVALAMALLIMVAIAGRSTADSLMRRIEGRNGAHVLEHGEVIGLGSRTYELVSIDN